MSRRTALVLGTLTVGVLDILDAFVFFGLRGARPDRILQSIASGVLGRAAYQGGMPAALLGLLLHFFIAFGVVAIYMIATRLLPALNRRPWIYGLLYGIVVYLVMNRIVVPLSAAAVGSGPTPLPVLVNGILIHLFGVGLPAALFARAAAGGQTGVRPGSDRGQTGVKPGSDRGQTPYR
jgi:hypothetical protein